MTLGSAVLCTVTNYAFARYKLQYLTGFDGGGRAVTVYSLLALSVSRYAYPLTKYALPQSPPCAE